MTAQFSSLEIDTSQAIKQLELLGYQQGDAVYVRAFFPKEDPRYLRSSVPLSENPELVQPKGRHSSPRPHVHVSPYLFQDISVPVPIAVPLLVCLSKESRALLNSGVNEGVRNTNGAKLARDLIGTANYLTSIGQQFDGDPQQLLQDYASRCTPPLQNKEVDAIWKSAEKDRPGPSCTPYGVETCIRAWYWNTQVKPNQNSSASSGSPDFGNDSSVGKNSPILDVTLHKRILKILSGYDSESMRSLALMNLADEVGRPYRQIELLAKLLTNEVDFQTDTLVAKQKLSSLLKTSRHQLDLTRLLEPNFARLLIDTANAMPTAPEFLFTTLLGTAASQVGSAARVIVKLTKLTEI